VEKVKDGARIKINYNKFVFLIIYLSRFEAISLF